MKKVKGEKTEPVIEKKEEKKRGGLLKPLLIGVIIGIIGGVSVEFLLMREFKSIKKNKEVKQEPRVRKKPPLLVNPATKNEGFEFISIRSLVGLEDNLNKIIQEKKKANKVSSVSVYFRDFTNNEVVGINETEIFSPASLMKVPVMISILKWAETDKALLDTKLEFTGRKEQNHVGGNAPAFNTVSGLEPGKSYSVEKLLNMMIVESDNEATIRLLEYLDQMRPGFRIQVQEELGLQEPVNVVNTENFITVRKYSSFFRTLYNSTYLTPELSDKALRILSETGFAYGMRQAAPQSVKVSHKFGFKKIGDSSFQLHHFGIVYHQKKPYLLGVMTKGKTMEDLEGTIKSIAVMVYSMVDEQSSIPNSRLEQDIN